MSGTTDRLQRLRDMDEWNAELVAAMLDHFDAMEHLQEQWSYARWHRLVTTMDRLREVAG